MNMPLWTLLIVALMPYVLAGFGGYYRHRQFDKVDNNNPRRQQEKLLDAGARAVAAQKNAFEAVGLFTATLVIAYLGGVDLGGKAACTASSVFLASRILHPIMYIKDLATVRTIVFIVGFISCIYLMVLAAL